MPAPRTLARQRPPTDTHAAETPRARGAYRAVRSGAEAGSCAQDTGDAHVQPANMVCVWGGAQRTGAEGPGRAHSSRRHARDAKLRTRTRALAINHCAGCPAREQTRASSHEWHWAQRGRARVAWTEPALAPQHSTHVMRERSVRVHGGPHRQAQRAPGLADECVVPVRLQSALARAHRARGARTSSADTRPRAGTRAGSSGRRGKCSLPRTPLSAPARQLRARASARALDRVSATRHTRAHPCISGVRRYAAATHAPVQTYPAAHTPPVVPSVGVRDDAPSKQ